MFWQLDDQKWHLTVQLLDIGGLGAKGSIQTLTANRNIQ